MITSKTITIGFIQDSLQQHGYQNTAKKYFFKSEGK